MQLTQGQIPVDVCLPEYIIEETTETRSSTGLTVNRASIVELIKARVADGTIPTSGGGGAVTSVAGRTGAVVLTKADVSLANVDNTSDANKPVSTAQSTAIGLKADLTITNNLTTLSGVAANATSLGTFTGNTISDNVTNKQALQQLETGLEATVAAVQNKIQLKQSGTNVGSNGTFTKYNFIGATIAANGGDASQADVTISGGSSTISQYSAGANVLVTASNTGITATKSGSAWTVTVPSGVSPISVSINVLNTDVSDVPDAGGAADWVTVRFTGAGLTSGATFGTYKFPALTAHIQPLGAPSVTNVGQTNTTATAIIGIGANEFTLRKANMSQTENTVLTFTGF